VLYLRRADFLRRLFQRIEGRRQWMADEFGPARARADDDMRGGLRNAAQFAEAVDVEHVFAKRPVAERRIEIGAAGQYPPSRLGQQRQRLVECFRFRVTDHAMPRGASRPVGATAKIVRMQMISAVLRMSKTSL